MGNWGNARLPPGHGLLTCDTEKNEIAPQVTQENRDCPLGDTEKPRLPPKVTQENRDCPQVTQKRDCLLFGVASATC